MSLFFLTIFYSCFFYFAFQHLCCWNVRHVKNRNSQDSSKKKRAKIFIKSFNKSGLSLLNGFTTTPKSYRFALMFVIRKSHVTDNFRTVGLIVIWETRCFHFNHSWKLQDYESPMGRTCARTFGQVVIRPAAFCVSDKWMSVSQFFIFNWNEKKTTQKTGRNV